MIGIRLALLLLLIRQTTPTVLYCLSNQDEICYVCPFTYSTRGICEQINNQTKIIDINSNYIINYRAYLNTSVRIIEKPSIIIFFTCSTYDEYLIVHRESYYPIDKGTLNLSGIPFGVQNNNISTRFQYCLLLYCTIRNNNRFICYDIHLESLEFYFVGHVSLACVQNITYAYIRSNTVSNISINYFFRNAYNIIYLRLEFENLKFIEPATFSNLFNLKILKVTSADLVLNYQDIFYYSPSLVQIIFNSQWFWNDCSLDLAAENSSVIFTITYTGCCVFSILLLAIVLTVYHRCQRKHCFNEIQLCRIQAINSNGVLL